MTVAIWRPADPRPLALGWTAVLVCAGVLCALFGMSSGRAEAFGPRAWYAVCTAPVLLGLGLAFTSAADREQYALRGLALALMAPIGLAMWAGTADGPAPLPLRALLLGVGGLVLQLVAWLGLLMWCARVTTRLAPAAGGEAVAPDRLQQRLTALPAAGAPLRLAADGSRHLAFDLEVDPSGERAHRVRLRLDARRRTVQVTEHLGAWNAAPEPGEASFHRPGDPIGVPRPTARRIASRTRQATPLDATAIAACPLHLEGDGVRLDGLPPGWQHDDAEGRGRLGVALLAAVVLGSGWVWQPTLLVLRQRAD